MKAENITYKECGIPWLGQIPEGWEVVKIKHVLSYKKGKNPQKYSNTPTKYIYLTAEFLREKSEPLYIEDVSGLVRVFQGDLLLLWDGANAGELFEAKDGYLSSTMAVLNFKYLNKAYAKYYLFVIERELRRQTIGMGIPHVNSNFFINLPFLIPTNMEQKAIARFLDEKCAQIDSLIDKKQKLIALLIEQKSALISEVVTKGLDPQAPLKDSTIPWLGQIPEHWEVRKVKYLTTLRNQKAINCDFKIGLENIESKTGKYIQTNDFVFEDDGIKFFEGDILFGKLRPYLAKVFLANKEGICVSEFLVLKSERIYNRYLKFLMLGELFINVVDGSTYGTKMPRANWDFIGNLKIPLPPLEEQKAIAEFLDKKIEEIDSIITKTKEQIKLFKEYKNTLITEATCGRMEIKERK